MAAQDVQPVAAVAPDVVVRQPEAARALARRQVAAAGEPRAAAVAELDATAAAAEAAFAARSGAQALPAVAAPPDARSVRRLPADVRVVRDARRAASAAVLPLAAAVVQRQVVVEAMTAPDLLVNLAAVAARLRATLTARVAE